MIKWKNPNEAVSSKNKPKLIDIWNNVKHLEPLGLGNIPGWSKEDQQLLDNLKTDGWKNLHCMYVSRRPLRRKMVTLIGQVNAMLPDIELKC